MRNSEERGVFNLLLNVALTRMTSLTSQDSIRFSNYLWEANFRYEALTLKTKKFPVFVLNFYVVFSTDLSMARKKIALILSFFLIGRYEVLEIRCF